MALTTVQQGQTLRSIAESRLPSGATPVQVQQAAQAIAEANGLSAEARLEVGQQLVLPDVYAGSVSTNPTTAEAVARLAADKAPAAQSPLATRTASMKGLTAAKLAKQVAEGLASEIVGILKQASPLEGYLFSDELTLECMKAGTPDPLGDLSDALRALDDGPQWHQTGTQAGGFVLARDPLDAGRFFVFPEGYFRKMRVEAQWTQQVAGLATAQPDGTQSGPLCVVDLDGYGKPRLSTADLTQTQPYFACEVGADGALAVTYHARNAQEALLHALPARQMARDGVPAPIATLYRGTTDGEGAFVRALQQLVRDGIVDVEGLAAGLSHRGDELAQPARERLEAIAKHPPQDAAARESVAREILALRASGASDASFWTSDANAASMWSGGVMLKAEMPIDALRTLSKEAGLFIGREYGYDELAAVGDAVLSFYLNAVVDTLDVGSTAQERDPLGGTSVVDNPDA